MEKLQFQPRRVAKGSEAVPRSLGEIEPTFQAGSFATLLRAKGANGSYAIKLFENATYTAAQEEYLRLETLRGCGCVPDVHCLGLVTYEGKSYPAIVEDHIDGRTLSDVVEYGLLTGKAKAPLSDIDVVTIMYGNAQVLGTFRNLGIAHRDLSLSNAILTSDCIKCGMENGAHVVLIDLGQSTFGASQVTPNDRMRLATIAIAAPEMYGGIHYGLRNECSVDAYSLALLAVALRIGHYWWPDALLELKSELEHGHILQREDLASIVIAKSEPVNLCEILEAEGLSITEIDRKVSPIVYRLTAFDPTLRLPIAAVEKELHDILQEAGKPVIQEINDGGKASGSVSVTTPLVPRARVALAPVATKLDSPEDWSVSETTANMDCAAESSSSISTETLRRLAEHGDTTASRLLGLRYITDQVSAPDPEEGVRLLRNAADGGDAEAAYQLGCLYWDGLKVQGNPLESIRRFEQASNASHPGASYRLGWCYEHGLVGARDTTRAAILYRAASGQKHAPAMRRLAMMLWEGRGIPRDAKHAARLFKNASDLGDAPSTRSLGWCYECGQGVPLSVETAKSMYRLAVSQGDRTASELLDRLSSNN